MRFGACPSKIAFLKDIMNIIDFVAIVPYVSIEIRTPSLARSRFIQRIVRMQMLFSDPLCSLNSLRIAALERNSCSFESLESIQVNTTLTFREYNLTSLN